MNELKLEDDGDSRKKFTRKKKDGDREDVEFEVSDGDRGHTRNMAIGEMQKILQDPDHPRYDQAQEQSHALGEQLSGIIAPSLTGYNKMVDGISSNLTKSFLGDSATSILKPEATKLFEPIEVPELPDVHNPITDVVEGQQELIERMGQTNEALALLLEQSRKDAAEQTNLLKQQIADAHSSAASQQKAYKRERIHGIWALAAAWAAVATTVIFGFLS